MKPCSLGNSELEWGCKIGTLRSQELSTLFSLSTQETHLNTRIPDILYGSMGHDQLVGCGAYVL